jgi:thiol-disulfide isomerase/thioredoxin
LVDKNGRQVSFETLSEKPVFLNIWATWCPPCVAEIPGIVELYNEYADEVNFILVSNEDPAIVQKFAEKHNYHELPFYYARYTPDDFASQSIPTTFVIDRNGRVLINKKGAARWNSDKTEKVLEQLIGE